MKMKAKKIVLLLVCLCTILAGCSSPADTSEDPNEPTGNGGDQVIKLTYGHIHNPGHSLNLAAQEYKNLVEEKTEGRVIIELYPSSQLGSARDMMEQVAMGTLDISHAATSDWAAGLNAPDLGVYDLPFLYPNVQAQNAVIRELLEEDMKVRLEDQPVMYLHAFSNGIRNFLSAKGPVNSIDDIKGIKVRTAENPQYVQLWQALGSNVVTSAWSEAYTVVQTGVADACEADAVGLVAANLHEVGKYYSRTSHIGNIYIALINRDKWASIPEDLQEILMACSLEVALKQLDNRVMQDDEAEVKIAEIGVEINDVTSEERQKMIDACAHIYDEFDQQYGVGDYIQTLLDFTANYY